MIIPLISKVETAIRVSVHCRNQPLWQEQKQHIITRRHPKSHVQWRMQRMHAVQHRLFGSCISINQRAWLDETYRPSVNVFGDLGPFVLPHLICDSKIDTNLKPDNIKKKLSEIPKIYSVLSMLLTIKL